MEGITDWNISAIVSVEYWAISLAKDSASLRNAGVDRVMSEWTLTLSFMIFAEARSICILSAKIRNRNEKDVLFHILLAFLAIFS